MIDLLFYALQVVLLFLFLLILTLICGSILFEVGENIFKLLSRWLKGNGKSC